ncbi:protein of unknown function (DUF1833) [Rhizobium leguminosarum bv. trifolii WSM597]|uniref:DUF1833 domain-containing protein n=1 Tax=Rhizobium leguminosarum bv. trifolii WSM597 TaxID=754764 RepID=J0GZ66_RHILT|nr:DUF1833 family protein [Rhizobium leguminosarum]EJB02878.1 protein of unknown function (DUF1833) [Rhizobium leguminosarum bv. trifolii WSM597]
MSRDVTDRFREAVYAQETDEVPICLLTITHESMEEPIYISSDPSTRLSDDPLIYGTESRGEQYIFLPFEFTLPDDKSDSAPRVQLTMDNIDRTLVSMLRTFATPPSIKLEIILAADPDTVEITVPVLQMSDATFEDHTISITLVADSLINEPHPAGRFTPGAFPGLF